MATLAELASSGTDDERAAIQLVLQVAKHPLLRVRCRDQDQWGQGEGVPNAC